ncbi:MAG: ATP-binding protein, partial [Ancrocorticia sp.]
LAGVLAMGAFPQEFFPRLNVTFSEFPGTSKSDIREGMRLVDRATFEGPIPEIVESVIEKVQSNMRTAGQIEGVYRKDLPDYPLVAIREAIVNALMHRDYSPDARGTQVQVNMFVDRLEITNPGGLYGAVTLRTLGQAGLSSTRNQRLSALLETVRTTAGGPVAENRGTGIAIMQSELSNSLMPPPEFRDDLASFTVVFRRRHVAPAERYLTALSRVQQELTERESASTAQLMEELGLSRTSIQNAVNKLIESGIVEATEPPKSPRQRYRIVRS